MAARTYGDRIYGELTATFTKHHKLKIIYKNYEYMEASRTAVHIWMRCTCQKEHKCQARLKISIEEPFSILDQSKHWHNHMPKHDAQLLADAALRMMVAELQRQWIPMRPSMPDACQLCRRKSGSLPRHCLNAKML